MWARAWRFLALTSTVLAASGSGGGVVDTSGGSSPGGTSSGGRLASGISSPASTIGVAAGSR